MLEGEMCYGKWKILNRIKRIEYARSWKSQIEILSMLSKDLKQMKELATQLPGRRRSRQRQEPVKKW